MKLLKTSLRNKMEEEFLADSMIVSIEREFTASIDTNSIIDEFYAMKLNRRHIFSSLYLDRVSIVFESFSPGSKKILATPLVRTPHDTKSSAQNPRPTPLILPDP